MLNFLTFDQLDYQCLKQAGNLTDNDIYPVTRQNYINSKLMKIYGLLDGINDPFYNRVGTFTIQNTANRTVILNAQITSIVSSTNTITRSDSGTFVVGDLLNANLWTVSGSAWTNFVARVLTVDVTGKIATYEVIVGTDADFTWSNVGVSVASVIISAGASEKKLDCSNIYFKDFLSVYDGNYMSTPGAQIRVFDKIVDSRVFLNRSLDINALRRIAWYQRGSDIILFVGSSAISLDSTVTGEYRGKPAVFTSLNGSSIIDIPPEINQALLDEVTACYLTELTKPVPADIQSRLQTYEKKFYDASEANKTNALEKLNK